MPPQQIYQKKILNNRSRKVLNFLTSLKECHGLSTQAEALALMIDRDSNSGDVAFALTALVFADCFANEKPGAH